MADSHKFKGKIEIDEGFDRPSPHTEPSEEEVAAFLAEYDRWDDGFISGRGSVWNKTHQVYRRNDAGEFDLVSEHASQDECTAALKSARVSAALRASSLRQPETEAIKDALDEFGAPGFGDLAGEEEHEFTTVERIRAFGLKYAAISRELGELRLRQPESGEAAAWMHPTEGWVHHRLDEVTPHCHRDGPQPVPLYAHPQSPAIDDKSLAFRVIADIREKTGVGAKPMLTDLADAVAARCVQSPASQPGAVVKVLSLDTFAVDLRVAMHARRATLRSLESEITISKSAISRACRGKSVSQDNFIALWNWLAAAPPPPIPLAADGWQDIATAPRDGTKFDAWQRDSRVVDVYWSDVQDAWCIDGSYGPEEPLPLAIVPPVTRWRPLPAPPLPGGE